MIESAPFAHTVTAQRCDFGYTWQVVPTSREDPSCYCQSVGADPDVLAFDESFGRLYVSAESGIITIFDERGRNLEKVGEGFFAANAHSVSVDSRTHRVYFPLQNVGGKPILRIALPSDKQL